MKWTPIEAAPKEPGREIIGVCFYNGRITKEPFITFWTPALGRFYCNPTHYIEWPEFPAALDNSSKKD